MEGIAGLITMGVDQTGLGKRDSLTIIMATFRLEAITCFSSSNNI
ncbi:MAG: hypothetical protein QW478_05320 [Candidatus Micrarchaeaceae archaeon]